MDFFINVDLSVNHGHLFDFNTMCGPVAFTWYTWSYVFMVYFHIMDWQETDHVTYTYGKSCVLMERGTKHSCVLLMTTIPVFILHYNKHIVYLMNIMALKWFPVYWCVCKIIYRQLYPLWALSSKWYPKQFLFKSTSSYSKTLVAIDVQGSYLPWHILQCSSGGEVDLPLVGLGSYTPLIHAISACFVCLYVWVFISESNSKASKNGCRSIVWPTIPIVKGF